MPMRGCRASVAPSSRVSQTTEMESLVWRCRLLRWGGGGNLLIHPLPLLGRERRSWLFHFPDCTSSCRICPGSESNSVPNRAADG